jgi:tetratricopeptide (TPR) repeat protein
MSTIFQKSNIYFHIMILVLMMAFSSCKKERSSNPKTTFDKEKIDNLLQKTDEARKLDPLSIVALADSTILLSKQLNYRYGELKGMYNKAIGLFYESKPDDAFEWCNQLIEKLASVTDLELDQRHNIFGSAYTLKGVILERKGNYELAIESLLKALDAFELSNKSDNIALVYLNLSSNFTLIKDYEKALLYIEKAETIYLENKSYQALLNVYQNKGNIYKNQGKNEQALAIFEKTLDSAKVHDDFNNIARALNNIGVYHEEKNNLELAIEYYLNANLINEERKDFWTHANTLGNISLVYLKAKDFDKAINYSNKALRISMDNEFLELIKFNYENLARIYEEKGDFEESLNNYKNYLIVKDSLYDEQKFTAISNLEQKYNKEKSDRIIAQKDKDLIQAQLQSRKLTTFVVILSLIILLSLTIAFFLFRQAKFRKEKNDELRQMNAVISNQKEDLQILVNAYEIKREKDILIGKEQILLDDIVYIRYQNRISSIFLTDGSIIENRTQLSQLLSDLKYKSYFLFSQINQNYIVNFANMKIEYFQDENEKYYYTPFLPNDFDEGRNEDHVKTRKRSGLNTNFEREYKRYLRMKQPQEV